MDIPKFYVKIRNVYFLICPKYSIIIIKPINKYLFITMKTFQRTSTVFCHFIKHILNLILIALSQFRISVNRFQKKFHLHKTYKRQQQSGQLTRTLINRILKLQLPKTDPSPAIIWQCFECLQLFFPSTCLVACRPEHFVRLVKIDASLLLIENYLIGSNCWPNQTGETLRYADIHNAGEEWWTFSSPRTKSIIRLFNIFFFIPSSNIFYRKVLFFKPVMGNCVAWLVEINEMFSFQALFMCFEIFFVENFMFFFFCFLRKSFFASCTPKWPN